MDPEGALFLICTLFTGQPVRRVYFMRYPVFEVDYSGDLGILSLEYAFLNASLRKESYTR